MSQALRIAAAEWRCWRRSRLLVATLGVFALLLAATAVLSAARNAAEQSARLGQQHAADHAFTTQPSRHPHRMVHYGHYVFRAPPPLAVFDPGIDSVAGQALFLEGHRQNSAGFAEAPAAAAAGGFGVPSPALVYQILVPLLLIALGHAAFARERESGTLAPLLAQGVAARTVLLGKALALAGAAALALLPAAILAGMAVGNGESAVITVLHGLLHAAYLGAWVLLVMLVAAVLLRRSEVLVALLLAWIAIALVLPRLAASHAALDAPAGGKIGADIALLTAMRDGGDGHNAADPAFDALRARLLVEHGVERVEDLPVNFRGIVATVAEARLTELLNAAADRRMAQERTQSSLLSLHAWASPALATGLASRALAGTDLLAQHRFLRDAEALRFEFVQALNRVHATQLDYADDIRRSSDVEAERRTRVDARHWQLLREFRFVPAPPEQRAAAPARSGAVRLAAGAAVRNPFRCGADSPLNPFLRELRLLLRDRGAIAVLALALFVASVAVVSGWLEIRTQRNGLEALIEADRRERAALATQHADWGSVAYYTFHLTWQPPSDFAFAALGQRKHGSWQHRVRMLALEGQIHEPDASHPELALLGRFDFAFVAATLAPLLAILLLYGLAASERAAGRQDLLVATARGAQRLWLTRGAVRLLLLAAALLLPLAIGAAAAATTVTTIVAAATVVVIHLLFWWLLCAVVDRGSASAATQLMQLIGIWIALAVVAPAAISASSDRRHSLPEGAAILMAQREAVNDAWDLPKAQTMAAFSERHPQWAIDAEVTQPFEWKWYFAFQQVGDEAAESMSRAHREGRMARDRTAATLSRYAPPAWVERQLAKLAATDTAAVLAYEQTVRDFHAALREWYYPRLFRSVPFTSAALDERPEFEPNRD